MGGRAIGAKADALPRLEGIGTGKIPAQVVFAKNRPTSTECTAFATVLVLSFFEARNLSFSRAQSLATALTAYAANFCQLSTATAVDVAARILFFRSLSCCGSWMNPRALRENRWRSLQWTLAPSFVLVKIFFSARACKRSFLSLFLLLLVFLTP